MIFQTRSIEEVKGIIELFSLKGKKAFVSGASRGLGREIALTLAEAGADVALGARNIEALNETAALIKKMGRGFVGILGDTLPREEHEKAAEAALELFKKESASGKWDLIVLDEINVAVSLGLLGVEAVKDAIRDFPEDKLLILTGRDAHPELIELADLATDMRELKHPFNDGKPAKPGIEF